MVFMYKNSIISLTLLRNLSMQLVKNRTILLIKKENYDYTYIGLALSFS